MRSHSRVSLKAASGAEQMQAASVLHSLISLALLTVPVDVAALEYIKRTAAFFEVRAGHAVAAWLLEPGV